MLSIQFIIACSMMFLILFGFLDFKKQKKVLLLNVTIIVIFLLIDITRFFNYGYFVAGEYDAVIGLPVVVFMSIYMLSGLKKIQAWVTVFVALLVMSFATMSATTFLFRTLSIDMTLFYTNGFYTSIGNFAGLILLSIIYVLTRTFKLEISITAISKGELLFIIIFIYFYGFVIGFVDTVIQQYEDGFWQLLTSFGLVVSGVLIIYFVLYLTTQKTTIKNIQMREQQQIFAMEHQTKYYESLLRKDLEFAEFKHNIRDEIKFLSGILGDVHLNDIEARKQALSYISEMTNVVDSLDKMAGPSLGSEAVNASWYLLTTSEIYQNVKTEWKGKIEGDVKISQRDMHLLFSNLLSNAFEAAVNANSSYVDVTIKSQNNEVSIVIKNGYDTEIKKLINDDFETSKDDKKNHGMGIKIVKNIVDKYNGKLKLDYSNGEFTAIVIFNDVFISKIHQNTP